MCKHLDIADTALYGHDAALCHTHACVSSPETGIELVTSAVQLSLHLSVTAALQSLWHCLLTEC